MNVSRLIYVSTAAFETAKEDIDDILATARRVNGERNVTGLLIFDGKCFMQLLEGHQAEIQHIFEEISRDKRHQNITVILRQADVARQFPDWSMGYSLLEDARILQGEDWFPLTPIQLEMALPKDMDDYIRVLFTSFLSVSQPA